MPQGNDEFKKLLGTRDDYSPYKFYGRELMKGEKNDGGAHKASVWLPKSMWSQISEIVWDRDFPEGTNPSTIIRDFVVHGVYRVGVIMGNPERTAAAQAEMRRAEIARFQERLDDARLFVEDAKKITAGLREQRDYILGLEYKKTLEERLPQLRDPYRQQIAGYLEELKGWLDG